MKKATSQKITTGGTSGDSERLAMKKLDHAVDIAKTVVATSGKFADWGKQASVTKAAIEGSKATVRAAEEKTQQTAWVAVQDMSATARLRQKDNNEHTQAMAKLQMDYEQMKTIDRERERVLDKILNEPESLEQLANSYRALIPPKS